MRLITPYTFKILQTIDEIYITDKDVIKFSSNCHKDPDIDPLKCDACNWIDSTTLFSSFVGTDYSDYRVKSILLVNSDLDSVVGIINEDKLQVIPSKNLNFRITFNSSSLESIPYLGALYVNNILNTENIYYGPSEGSDIITTHEQALKVNNQEQILKGYVQQKNESYVNFLNSLKSTSPIRILFTNIIKGKPLLKLFVGTNDLKEINIDLSDKSVYTNDNQFKNLLGFKVYPINQLIGFFDKSSRKDLLSKTILSSFPSCPYWYHLDGKVEISFIKDTYPILGYTYQEIADKLGINPSTLESSFKFFHKDGFFIIPTTQTTKIFSIRSKSIESDLSQARSITRSDLLILRIKIDGTEKLVLFDGNGFKDLVTFDSYEDLNADNLVISIFGQDYLLRDRTQLFNLTLNG